MKFGMKDRLWAYILNTVFVCINNIPSPFEGLLIRWNKHYIRPGIFSQVMAAINGALKLNERMNWLYDTSASMTHLVLYRIWFYDISATMTHGSMTHMVQ